MLTVNQLAGFGAGGTGLFTTGLQAHYDVGKAASYSGSGQNFLDLTSNSYDLYLGTGSGSDAADPTYNAGPPAYFSFDGSDYFTPQAAYSGSILRVAGQQGQEVSMEAWVYLPNSGACFIAGTTNGGVSSTNGVAFEWDNTNQRINLLVGPLNSRTGTNSTDISTGVWHQLGFEGTFDGSSGTFYVDGQADGTWTANNSGWTTGDSASSFSLGAGAGNTPLSNTSRMAIFRAYDQKIGAAGFLQNFEFNRDRFGI
ncbi:MAG: LamG-like jellyroll fold domain-containing protein [Pseudomonadota bacterium]|nr:LamG-like jellyroll fold domain-containing protein [Pseudomonadota bacterium]